MKVLKFGGTSVGSVEQLHRVVRIVCGAAVTHRVVVVTSAASGVTDTLSAAADAIDRGAFSPAALEETLWLRYHLLAAGLLRPQTLGRYEGTLRTILSAQVRDAPGEPGPTPALRDRLLAVGERLAAPLLALALQDAGLDAGPHDAAGLIRTDDTHGEACVDVAETCRRVRAWHGRLAPSALPVVTGFIGAAANGVTTTLGRGGSDYSAALLAAALEASVLERWTDVVGLYTEDPRANRRARRLARIGLEEARAWNHAGRLGMHRKALDPVMAAEIPVHVRCTASPEEQGTWIFPAGYEEPVAAMAS